MDRLQPDDAGSSLVRITVLSVTPAHTGKLFALASVEVDIDGVQIAIHGIRAVHVADPVGTRISPRPDRRRGIRTLIERGIANRRFATPISAG